jgi:hypothetical protein
MGRDSKGDVLYDLLPHRLGCLPRCRPSACGAQPDSSLVGSRRLAMAVSIAQHLQALGDDFGRVLFPAFLVLPGFRGRDRDACHSAAFRGVTQFRIAAEVTQEDHLPLVGDFPSFGEIVETLNREGHELLHPGPGRGVQRCLPRRDGNRGDAGLLPHDSACVAAEALRNAFRHAKAIPAAAHAHADATRRSWLADKLPSKSEGSGS